MTAPTHDQHAAELIRRAREHMRSGRPEHAEALAEVALAWEPDDGAAMAILGRTALLRGDHARAAGVLRPVAAQRQDPACWHDLARALVGLDRCAEAAEAFRRAAELAPADGDIANDLGVVLAELGRIDDAAAMFRRAMTLPGRVAEARDNLATALRQLGRTEEAAALTVSAPEDAAGLDRQADLLAAEGSHAEAISAGARAIALQPDNAELRRRHAQRLQSAGRLEEAEAVLRAALALAPDSPAVHADLGWVLRRQDRLDEAIGLLSAAAQRWPDEPHVQNSTAIALLNAGRAEATLALLERAAVLHPDDAEVQHNRAMALLRLGRFAEGWEAYEWRWRMGQGRASHRMFPQPLWTGEPLAGRTILLHAEQGLGDALQFLRYVPLVAEHGGRVVLEVPAALGRLALRLPGVGALVWAGDPLPPFDVHAPLLSLPRAFGTTVETIPPAPYLTAEPGLIAAWRERVLMTEAAKTPAPLEGLGREADQGWGEGWPPLPSRPPSRRVGLVWAGRTQHWEDARRSLPFAALAPLWGIPNISWFSLQVGPRAADLAAAPRGVVTDLGPMLGDFADTAAALGALDLLICVDTATLHLAGALGRPAWLLLAFAADWRWMRDPTRTPWYPSVRMFRQEAAGAWGDVVARVAAALGRGEA